MAQTSDSSGELVSWRTSKSVDRLVHVQYGYSENLYNVPSRDTKKEYVIAEIRHNNIQAMRAW